MSLLPLSKLTTCATAASATRLATLPPAFPTALLPRLLSALFPALLPTLAPTLRAAPTGRSQTVQGFVNLFLQLTHGLVRLVRLIRFLFQLVKAIGHLLYGLL